MNAERWWQPVHAFDHPVTLWICVGIAAGLAAAWGITEALARAGKLSDKARTELRARIGSWLVIVPAMMLPVLIAPGWVAVAVLVLSLLCYREFARATGLFRHRLISATVAVGIVLVGFAAADKWYGLFVASWTLIVCATALVGLLADRPDGYIQRVALGVFAFTLIGVGLGHVSYIANGVDYRPILAWLLLCVELNDVLAYLCGKTFGRRKFVPNTSPNKTLGGALGALVLTTLIAAGIGHFVFRDTALDTPVHLLALGVLISVLGQAGDLVLSSIKRDLGIKDMAATIPGHGGLLDRFDSMLLVAPAVFHYLRYFMDGGFAVGPERLITGG